MNSAEIELYKKAGNIAKEVKKFAISLEKKNKTLLELAEAIEEKIRELGAEPAFPVNTSIDEIAAHYTPRPMDETMAEGLLKLDIGVCVEGFIADMAISFDLTENEEHRSMMEVNKKILSNIKESMKQNWKIKEVGEIAEDTLDEFNEQNETKYNLITNLCGHNLDKDKIHAGITIPNHKNDSTIDLLERAFAIEPFVTSGEGFVYEGEGGGIYKLQNESPVRDKDVREILNFIKANYTTRPFCERWLRREEFKKIKFALSILTKQGILHHYPLLIEKSKMPVSQFENSFLISEKEVVCLTE